jgi:molybdopterin-guanine dinucleotide biosynthesis protein A
MNDAAAIVLAGGQSSRMGSPKAGLDWHGSTLLRRITGIVARAVDGPVIVVRAAGQALPALPPSVEVVEDARAGRGPLQGLAAGLEAIGDRAEVAYASSTDVPLLHPAFVRCVVRACGEGVDVALPELAGHRQLLAAAYRVSLLPTVEELIGADRLRLGLLTEHGRVRSLDAAGMLADVDVARGDPELASALNVNDPAAYERAQALPPPAVRVTRCRQPGSVASWATVTAWTLRDLAGSLEVTLGAAVRASLNGQEIAADPELPLVSGDVVALAPRA